MKKKITPTPWLPFVALFFVFGCSTDAPSPSQDISQLQGNYNTNGLLDPSCVFISDPSQLPSLQITKQVDDTYRVVRTDYIPTKSTNTLENVKVRITPDTTFILHEDKQIGKLFMSTFPDFNSQKPRDITAPRLFITYMDPVTQKFLSYSGYRK